MIQDYTNKIYVPDYSEVSYRKGNPNPFLHSLQQSNSTYFLSLKEETVRIIHDNRLHIFMRKKNSSFDPKSIYLFKRVKDSALTYVKENDVEVPISYPVNYVNNEFQKRSQLISTDINNAYWRIAFNSGIIDGDTYERGILYKTTSLASLAVLGKDAKYNEYKGYELMTRCVIKGNKKLQDLYAMIRYSCYGYMNEIKETLADDFYKWRTDEVIYNKTDKNIDAVHEILSSKNLTYKDTILT